MITVISVRFRSGCKTYYFDPGDLLVRTGQDVIVETSQGVEFAQCAEGNHAVADEAVVAPLRPVLRVATDNDRHTAAYNRGRESEAFDICQKKILQHGLDMKLVRVECSFDGSKILFFFTADGRVDFRDLVKDLAGVFRSRIELRQIGVRDEAKMLGGLGICGRPFCCASYLDEFVPVSIKMAKTQNLSLNPTKISGTCGRLMCCLKYEQDAYEDALHRLPKQDSFVLTPDGAGNVSDVSILKETVNVRLDDRPEAPRCYHNCEVCVLRSGKGSRDGIAVPQKRPERYVSPTSQDEVVIPSPMTGDDDFIAAAESADTAASSRRRSRGGRRRGGAEAASAPRDPRPPKAPKADALPAKGDEAAGAQGGEGNKPRTSRRRSRGGRGGAKPDESSAVPQAPKTSAPRMPKPPKAPAPQTAAPQPSAPSAPRSGDGKPRRPRRRGGYRRGGGNAGGSTGGEV